MKHNFNLWAIGGLLVSIAGSCGDGLAPVSPDAIKPTIVTEVLPHDTDDPAIWINPNDSTDVLILGTDKQEKVGGLYAFDLEGKIVNQVENMDRPNNVDIAYGLPIAGDTVDIAVVTERGSNKLRVYSLPDLKPLDNGGIPVFEDSEEKAPMGIALYTKKDSTGVEIYAVVSRKTGPSGSYLYQYLLDGSSGDVTGAVKRKFGAFLGGKEIEAIAVDNALGYIYYSDEGHGIHKYYADPAKGDGELALFGTEDFLRDHEGIAIYQATDSTGYILVSDQQRNRFNIYPREGDAGNPNAYTLITGVDVSAIECDGADATSVAVSPTFPKGMMVAMSNGAVFHYYDWQIIQDLIDQAKP